MTEAPHDAAKPDPAAPAAGPPAPRTRWHSAPWWAGVGGIATVLATVIAVVAFVAPWAADSTSAPEKPATTTSSADRAATPTDSSKAPAGAGADPIIATVVRTGDVSAGCGGKGFLLPKGLSQLQGDPPPSDDDVAGWFTAHGGVEVVNNVEITVENPDPEAAILTGMRAFTDSSEPAAGAVGGVFSCGGALDERYFVVDLAARPPTMSARPSEPLPGGSPQPAITFPFKVSASDPEDFAVVLKRPPGDVTWHLEISWTLRGVNGVTRIPKGNGEFRSTDAPFYKGGTAEEMVTQPYLTPGYWQN